VQRVNSFLVIIILIVSVAFHKAFCKCCFKEEVEASLELANEFLKNNYGFSNDYFREKSYYNKREINDKLAVKGNGLMFFGNLPVFVYGDMDEGAREGTKYGNDQRVYDAEGDPRALGFSFIDEPYPNPEFHIDEVTYVRRWIKEPWICRKIANGALQKNYHRMIPGIHIQNNI